MSDEQIIEYLRERGRGQPPAGFVRSVMTAIEDAPVAPWRFSPYLPAAMVAGAVAVVIVLALVLGPVRDVGPAPTPSPTTSSATVEELRDALTDATERLAGASGVQGLQTGFTGGYLGSATWFDWRPNGDQVVVQRQDRDITMTAWWMDPNGDPPAVGEHIVTNIWVLEGDAFYFASPVEWQVAGRERAPELVAFGVGLLSGQIDPLQPLEGLTPRLPEPDEGRVTWQDLPGRGRTWTLTVPYRDGTAIAEWMIDPNGALRSWSWELVDVSPDVESGSYTTSASLEFTPLTDPDPIQPPDVESEPDPTDFGLPSDFPLAPGRP